MLHVDKKTISDMEKSGAAKKLDKLIFFAPALVVLMFNLTFINRYFPLTEGWWETYAYLINKGLVPYRDFNLAFPPFFVMLNSFYLKYISNNFLVLRIIGAIFFSVSIYLLQVFLELFFDRKTAFMATMVAAFLSISDTTFIAKDYHTFVSLFTISSLLTAQYYFKTTKYVYSAEMIVNKHSSFKSYISLLILGIIMAALTLTKQNIGAFLFLAYGICITIVPTSSFFRKIGHLACYLGSFLLSFSLVLITYFPLDAISKLFIGNDSKGNLFVVLARFILDPHNRQSLAISFMLLTFYFLIIKAPNDFRSRLEKYLIADEFREIVNYLFAIIVLVTLTLSFVKSWQNPLFMRTIIPLSLSVLWYLFLKVHVLKNSGEVYEKYLFVVIPLILLAYCNTHTAGFNFAGMFFVIAFTVAFVLMNLLKRTSLKPVFIYLTCLFLVVFIIANKYRQPYNWWGLQQSSINKAQHALAYPSTKGIYVDTVTKEAFDMISDAILKYSRSDSDVYLFPDIPIFYYIHNKRPPYRNVVQWFDVISSKALEEELRNLRACPPNIIVFLDPPYFVYKGHAGLIFRPLVQLKFKKEFDKLADSGEYEVSKYYIYDQHLLDLYYPESATKRQIILKNDEFNKKSLSFLYNSIKDKGDFIIESITKNGRRLDTFDDDIILSRGDILGISVDDYSLKAVAESIGTIDDSEFYTLKIYVKKSKSLQS